MKNHDRNFTVEGLIKSFKHAFRGITVLFHNEYNLYIEISFAVIAIILGWYFHISPFEWMIQSMAIGLVIFSELMNTAIEKTLDLLHPEHHQKVADIKDMAAASVLFTVAISLVVGGILYIPRLVVLFF